MWIYSHDEYSHLYGLSKKTFFILFYKTSQIRKPHLIPRSTYNCSVPTVECTEWLDRGQNPAKLTHIITRFWLWTHPGATSRFNHLDYRKSKLGLTVLDRAAHLNAQRKPKPKTIILFFAHFPGEKSDLQIIRKL